MKVEVELDENLIKEELQKQVASVSGLFVVAGLHMRIVSLR